MDAHDTAMRPAPPVSGIWFWGNENLTGQAKAPQPAGPDTRLLEQILSDLEEYGCASSDFPDSR
jgi:hypothetical protein